MATGFYSPLKASFANGSNWQVPHGSVNIGQTLCIAVSLAPQASLPPAPDNWSVGSKTHPSEPAGLAMYWYKSTANLTAGSIQFTNGSSSGSVVSFVTDYEVDPVFASNTTTQYTDILTLPAMTRTAGVGLTRVDLVGPTQYPREVKLDPGSTDAELLLAGWTAVFPGGSVGVAVTTFAGDTVDGSTYRTFEPSSGLGGAQGGTLFTWMSFAFGTPGYVNIKAEADVVLEGTTSGGSIEIGGSTASGPSIVQASGLRHGSDLPNTPIQFSFPQAVTSGNHILVTVSGHNPSLFGGQLIATLSDNRGNAYTRMSGPSLDSDAVEAFLGLASGTNETQQLTLVPAINNTSNRLTWEAYEVRGLPSDSALDQQEKAFSAANSTDISVTTPSTTFHSETVFAILGTSYTSNPKNIGSPSGYSIIQNFESDGTSVGLQVLEKKILSIGEQTASWTMDAQANGSRALIITVRNNVTNPRAILILDQDLLNSVDIVYEVYAAPSDSTRIFGDFLFAGTLATAPATLDAQNNIRVELVPQVGVVLPGTSGIAVARGLKDGRRWGTGHVAIQFTNNT